MTYAIISLGGKQYRVHEGQRLVVDRLPHADADTFHPEVLLVSGEGKTEFAPKGPQVTAKVVGSVLGDKIRIGKYKRRTGYSRHAGHRSKLTQIEITAIGVRTAARKADEEKSDRAAKAAPKPKAAAVKAKEPTEPRPAAAKPKPAASAAKKAPARKAAPRAKKKAE
jgi:large subunit ribosomal protein L21